MYVWASGLVVRGVILNDCWEEMEPCIPGRVSTLLCNYTLCFCLPVSCNVAYEIKVDS